MSKRNDGGPAFPRSASFNSGVEVMAQTGMSLRDYFAAAALQSSLMAQAVNETPKREGITIGQHIAEIAYAIAERMLVERQK